MGGREGGDGRREDIRECSECTGYKRQREEPTAKRKQHCDSTSSECHGI